MYVYTYTYFKNQCFLAHTVSLPFFLIYFFHILSLSQSTSPLSLSAYLENYNSGPSFSNG